jgi:Ca2+-binding RTX toxin-like protein
MRRNAWFDSHDTDDHSHFGDNGHHQGDLNHHDDDDQPSAQTFEFDFPDKFKINLSSLDFNSLGKVTDIEVDTDLLSVTLGKKWTFEITGSDLEVTVKSGSKIPTISDGTIESFSVDGPGKADFSISGLDLDASTFSNALTHLNTTKLLSLLLGGNETISGSGYSDLLYGGKGNDHLLGNGGSDQLMGGAGKDIIDGGAGSDLLSGGGSADTFVFGAQSGMDLILDFDPDTDKLDLTALGFDSLDDVLRSHGRHDHHSSGDAVLDLGIGSMAKLLGVSASDLNSDNVLI